MRHAEPTPEEKAAALALEKARAEAAARVELCARVVDATRELLRTYDGINGHTIRGFTVANRMMFDAEETLAVLRKAVPR